MQSTETLAMLRKLLDDNKLQDWNCKLDNATRRFGQCNYSTKTISISSYLSSLNTEERVRETCLHEIAHALTDPRAGHGRYWQYRCQQLTIKPERYYTLANTITSPQEILQAYYHLLQPVLMQTYYI